jgi:hypothetical protein
MPRPRFRLLWLMALPVVVGVGMSLWIIYAPAVPIDGDQDVELEVEVRDADSGNPLGNALIQISDPYFYRNRKGTTRGTTRDDGRARILHPFKVVGEHRAYRLRGEVRYDDRWLEVSAPGYQRLLVPLTQFTGERGDLQRPSPIRVARREGESPGDVLQDIAGEYGCDFGQIISTIDILADGRFSWTEWGCFTYEKEYGFVRRADGAIRLNPIPRNQHKVNEHLLSPLYPITWNTCTFLLNERQILEYRNAIDRGLDPWKQVTDEVYVKERQILEYCNAINQGLEPRKQVTGDFHQPEDERERKHEGLPTVPGRWNTLLLKKPISATVSRVAQDGNATIDRGSEDGIWQGMHLKAQGKKGDPNPYREVEAVAVDHHSTVIRIVYPDCADRHKLSHFGDAALISGEKVTSRFREDGDEMPSRLDREKD